VAFQTQVVLAWHIFFFLEFRIGVPSPHKDIFIYYVATTLMIS